MTFANAWGSVLYTGNLYNAVQQEKLLSKSWKDMELVIALQSTEIMFVGDRPKGLEEYLKRFLLCMGYSATNFAPNRRKSVPAVSSRGPRGLEKLCKVGSLSADRYCNNEQAVAWTSDSLDPIMESMLDSDNSDNDDEDVTKSNAKKKVKTSATGALLRKSKSHRSTNIPTLDFLESLANALHAESVELTIDYLRLHRFCWMLLRQVNEACKPRLLEMYGAGYLEKECQLTFVIGYIFMTATTTSRIAGLLLPRRGDVEVSSRLLATAADCIQGMIDIGAGEMEIGMLERQLGFGIDLSRLDEMDDDVSVE